MCRPSARIVVAWRWHAACDMATDPTMKIFEHEHAVYAGMIALVVSVPLTVYLLGRLSGWM